MEIPSNVTNSKLSTPQIDPTTSWLCLDDDEVDNAMFLTAVGDVLGLDADTIPLHESFMSLGGSEEAARALRRACLEVGLSVRTKDILQCRTLAELESRVHEATSKSRCSSMSHAETLVIPTEPLPPITSLTVPDFVRRPPSRSSSRKSRRSSISSQSTRVQLVNEVEEVLSAEKAVQQVATARPKAGILEGKLVVFLQLTSSSAGDGPGNEIKLVSQPHAFFAGIQIASLRRTAELLVPADCLPEAWVALEKLPLNESGDIDRRKLRTWVQNMNDDFYQRILGLDINEFSQPPATDMERCLQRITGKALHLPPEQVGVNFSFTQLGGDEMLAMETVARCKHESIFLNASEVLEASTLSDLAALASSRGGLAHKWEEETWDNFDLAPMQQLYFRSTMGGDPHRRATANGTYRFNQSLLLLLKKHYSFEDISAAAQTIVGHHPMLRARFTQCVGKWTQRILPDVTNSYDLDQHTVSHDHDVEAIVTNTQTRINVETGPVFAVDYLSTNDGQQMLYLAAHHLAVDLASWRIIIHDLDELLENGSLLSTRSMPFQKWVEIQKSESENAAPEDVLPFDLPPTDPAYWGLVNGPKTYGDAVEVSFSLNTDDTNHLQTTCNQVFRTDPVDICLAALMLSFAQTFHDRQVPVVWNQEHGRDHWNPDVDISETVGWFTTLCPISQKIEGSEEFVDVLRRLKDLRRSIPAHGAQYFASKLLNKESTDFGAEDRPFEVIFSYAGSMQHLQRDNGVLEQLAIPAGRITSSTSDIGPHVGRIALFEVSALIDQGMAKIKILYSRQMKDRTRISTWIHNYERLLTEGIEQLQYYPQELTLADVPHLDVTYEGLETFNKQQLSSLNLMSVRDIDAIYPVTAVEQSILVSQVCRSETCYLHAIYEFASPTGEAIDIARICSAWQNVTLRHAALRTVFTESVCQTGLYDKVVLRRASPEMLFIDNAAGEDPIDELNNLPTLRSTDSKPNHRLTVCQAPAKTLVKLDISTAICDSLSIHLLIADLRRAYVTDRPISDSAQFTFPTYLKYLQKARREGAFDYWRNRLDGIQPCLFPRLTLKQEECQRMANAYLEVDISAQDLAAFARARNTTIGALLRLAWGLILRSFTGSNHVCFGYQTEGRESGIEDIRHAVGSFSNVVPCVYELDLGETLLSRLGAIDEQLAESLLYQHITIGEVQHELGIRGGDRLFNSCLTFTEEPADLNSKFTTRTNFAIKSVSHQQTFDMDFNMTTGFFNGRLAMDVSQRIMTQEQAISVARTFGRAVSAIMESPEGSIGGLNLFTDRDYNKITAWGNGSSKNDSPSRHVVHELVARQAVQQPDSQAICAWDGDFTFGELDDHTTKLAHCLGDAGVGPRSVVPVVVDKCRLAPIAMLAVLKTGAAFVPLDADELSLIQPIFDKLNSKVAVASDQAAPVLSNLFDTVVTINEDLLARLQHPSSQRRSMLGIVGPDDDACLLFTPATKDVRGVSFSHAALTTTFLNQGPAARIGHRSRVMQLSSFNLDIALAEIFTTLVQGGCVCIPSSAERLSDFTKAVNRMEVNWTYMTPLLSRKLDIALLPTLKVVCFRTRSLDEDTYSPWHGKVNVILAYGAQDVCPLGISFLEVIGTHHLKSIARPFAGSLWIINPDDHRKLVPVGAVGELVIEGPTLGWEYPAPGIYGREDLSLDIELKKKTRYFKTGHRVRYTEGGLIEFLASKREDLEMDGKIVNLTEIEQHLRRCLGQGVDVVVEALAFRGENTLPLLGAFVELGENLFEGDEDLTKLSVATKERVYIAKQLVETGLKNILPAYLIPSIFIPVRHLPVRSSLKVNRRRLQNLIHTLSKEQLMDLGHVENPKAVQSIGLKPLPLTQNEEKIRSVFARVLGVDATIIGAADTFFRAGGDEVKAVDLVTACRREGINVSIADVLGNATLTELSRGMVVADDCEEPYDRAQSTTPSPPVVTPPNLVSDTLLRVIAPKVGVHPQAIRDFAVASSTQIRHIESGMLRDRAGISYFKFNFTGPVNVKKLEKACQLLVETHPILRTAFVPHNRYVFQAVIKSFNVEFKKHYCAGWRLAGMEDKVIRKDRLKFIAYASPMTKFMFLDAGKQSTLIMRLSKAQYDDISIGLLVKELERLYDGVETSPRRPTFCEFVRCALSANSQGAHDYWKSLLEGSRMTQFVSQAKPYLVTANVKVLQRTMPIGSLEKLGISFDTVLKSAWAMVLAGLSGTSDVIFGEVIDGRHIRLPGGHSVVMGPLTNAIPVRVQFAEKTCTPLNLLHYVHAQRVAGIPYENLGLLDIVQYCTGWPYWMRFSTLVQHQEEDTVLTPGEHRTFHLGSASCKFGIVEAKTRDLPDVLVQSMLRGPNKVELSLTFDSERIPPAMADQALNNLCGAVGMLTNLGLMQPLIPAGHHYRALPKLIPISLRSAADGATMTPAIPLGGSSAPDWPPCPPPGLSEVKMHAILELINTSWVKLLNPWALGVREHEIPHANFYDLWGSIIPACQIAAYMNREIPQLELPGMDTSFQITMEEIVENPTMAKQFELVVGKLKLPNVSEKDGVKTRERPADDGIDVQGSGPQTQSSRKKPGVTNLSVGLGKSLRRFKSTVARASPTKQDQGAGTASTAITLAERISPLLGRISPSPRSSPGLSGEAPRNLTPTLSPGVEISPLTPNLSSSGGKVSLSGSFTPQLPNLPVFEAITEEEEEGEGDDESTGTFSQTKDAMMARDTNRSFGNLSSAAASMTTGSSVTSSTMDDRDRDNDSDTTPTGREASGSPVLSHQQLQPQLHKRVVTPPTVPTTPEISVEDEGVVVSALTPFSAKTETSFEGVSPASIRTTTNLDVQRNRVLNQVGLSPISG